MRLNIFNCLIDELTIQRTVDKKPVDEMTVDKMACSQCNSLIKMTVFNDTELKIQHFYLQFGVFLVSKFSISFTFVEKVYNPIMKNEQK